MAIARHSFDTSLCDWLESLPEVERIPQFWRLWTAHEAVLKQRGERSGKWISSVCRSRRYARQASFYITLPLKTGLSLVAVSSHFPRILARSW
ncbi:4'-phosphopantetheinyl transferase superfamily protein [Buttiauxella agrestis]